MQNFISKITSSSFVELNYVWEFKGRNRRGRERAYIAASQDDLEIRRKSMPVVRDPEAARELLVKEATSLKDFFKKDNIHFEHPFKLFYLKNEKNQEYLGEFNPD